MSNNLPHEVAPMQGGDYFFRLIDKSKDVFDLVGKINHQDPILILESLMTMLR